VQYSDLVTMCYDTNIKLMKQKIPIATVTFYKDTEIIHFALT